MNATSIEVISGVARDVVTAMAVLIGCGGSGETPLLQGIGMYLSSLAHLT